jgi:hypothetical protein
LVGNLVEKARSAYGWLQRHGPVLPLFTGLLALAVSAGTLSTLFLGLTSGRPRTPEPFAVWIGLSLFALFTAAIEWSRRLFIIFVTIVLALLVVLVAEFGENINRANQLSSARSTVQLLALELARAEHVAAASQLKALGESSTESEPTTTSAQGQAELVNRIASLRWDLQRVIKARPATPHLLQLVVLDQTLIVNWLIENRSTQLSSGTNVPGPGLSQASSCRQLSPWSTFAEWSGHQHPTV